MDEHLIYCTATERGYLARLAFNPSNVRNTVTLHIGKIGYLEKKKIIGDVPDTNDATGVYKTEDGYTLSLPNNPGQNNKPGQKNKLKFPSGEEEEVVTCLSYRV
jgi:hypothetical protein